MILVNSIVTRTDSIWLVDTFIYLYETRTYFYSEKNAVELIELVKSAIVGIQNSLIQYTERKFLKNKEYLFGGFQCNAHLNSFI